MDPKLNPCKCGRTPYFSSQSVPVFDEYDEPTQHTIQCPCGLKIGPNGSSKESLAKQWNDLFPV